MKKKGIIFSIIGILLVSSLLIVLVNKNNKKYIMQDGAMLALTLDGNSITSFPEGTNYRVEVECQNANGTWLVEDWKLGIEDITGNVICNIDFTTRDDTDKLLNVVESNTTQYYGSASEDAGYRYSGKTPNNYIWFNNEMWRIIGSIPTCTSSGCETSENLVKIIREESIGAIIYDYRSYVWGGNTLYSILNSYYYNENVENMNAQDNIGCSLYSTVIKANCDFRNKGILSTGYYGRMIKNVYWNSGITQYSYTTLVSYTKEIVTQTVAGYVGLMNPSDYGYAGAASAHSQPMVNYYPALSSSNWLFGPATEWTLNTYNRYVLVLYNGGPYQQYPIYPAAVRPVVYLDPSIYVVSGDGSISYPYQITME